MKKEYLILLIAWIITIAMLARFVPKNKIRQAWVIFFFKQMITWFVGLLVAEFGLIEYPVEIFKNATKTSFSFEYFIYPAICVVFNLHYPVGKSGIKQLLYFFYYCTAMTILEEIVERYMEIITYIHWTGYITWITLFMTFYISRRFYLWFFKMDNSTE
jgi:hypothetical protein